MAIPFLVPFILPDVPQALYGILGFIVVVYSPKARWKVLAMEWTFTFLGRCEGSVPYGTA